MRLRTVLWLSLLVWTGCTSGPPQNPAVKSSSVVQPRGWTAAVPHDADDPALWVHSTNPAESLILATDKIEKDGGLYAFGLDGALRYAVAPLDRPNNVDVEYGFELGRRRIDIAVVTERKRHRLRVFAIAAKGRMLEDIAPDGIPVLAGQAGEAAEPMGIGLYKRPGDGAIFAIVAPKTGAKTDYLWQYRLEADAAGFVTGTLVRRFGSFSQRGAALGEIGEIEAVAVDDELGYVYYADERFGIRKWHADPDHLDAGRELAVFAKGDYDGDREGLAIYATREGQGFIVSSDQADGGSRVHLYRREGQPGRPHDHGEAVAIVPSMSDQTDGLDVSSMALPGYPRGLLVMMNSGGKNFLLYSWEDIERRRLR